MAINHKGNCFTLSVEINFMASSRAFTELLQINLSKKEGKRDYAASDKKYFQHMFHGVRIGNKYHC